VRSVFAIVYSTKMRLFYAFMHPALEKNYSDNANFLEIDQQPQTFSRHSICVRFYRKVCM